jgi:hypothetical protein
MHKNINAHKTELGVDILEYASKGLIASTKA